MYVFQNQVDIDIYLPNDIWFDYYSKKKILSSGTIFNVAAPKDTIPLAIRGGFILPTQDPATTTTFRYTSVTQFNYVFI